MLNNKLLYICILNIILLCYAFNQSINQSDQIDLLKTRHNELINIFSSINNNDASEYLIVLDDDATRKYFLNALDIYQLTLSLALSNPTFILNTPTRMINTYKNDSKYFSKFV